MFLLAPLQDLCEKDLCSRCNCRLISDNQSDLPRLITVLSAPSIIWGGGDQRLTNSLKSALSFSGGVSSSVCVCKFKLASQMLNICNGGSDLWCRILLSLAEWTQKVVFLPVDWRRHHHGCGFWFSPGHAGPSQNQFKMSIEVTNSCPLRTSALTKSTKHLLESVCPHGPEEERFWCTHHW